MDNTTNTRPEYITEDGTYEALADPLFHFKSWLDKMGEEDTAKECMDEIQEYYERFSEVYPEDADTPIKVIFAGFAVGFNAANRVWLAITEDDEEKLR